MKIPRKQWRFSLRLIVNYTRESGKYYKLEYLKDIYPDAQQILKFLADAGYLKVIYRDNKSLPTQVCPTAKGNTYFELAHDELLRFIRRSILIPIAVAMLTTILFQPIATAIRQLLGL